MKSLKPKLEGTRVELPAFEVGAAEWKVVYIGNDNVYLYDNESRRGVDIPKEQFYQLIAGLKS